MSNQSEADDRRQADAVGCFDRSVRLLCLLLIVALGVFLLLPSGGHPRSIYRDNDCRNNLKQVMIAIHNYYDVYKCLPPAYIADEDGRPMHSWRVLVLSYLEQAELYEQYRFDEPWDGPNNSQLANRIPAVYRCPSEPNQKSNNTNYVLVAGDGSAWADGRTPTFADFAAGASNAIVLVEVADSGIPWTAPRDLSFEQAMRGINSDLGMCISAWHPARPGRERRESVNVALADGSVTHLKNDFPLEELRKLLTHQVGEDVKKIR